MPYPLTRLHPDIAQVQHEAAGFGTGRLVAENLILTTAHVLWNKETSTSPELEGWQVRLARNYAPGASRPWPFRRGNRVIWYDKDRDLALIHLVDPKDGPLRPLLQFRVATVEGNNAHTVEARGYPRASKVEDRRELTPVHGHLKSADQDRPLRLGVDTSDRPNHPHEDWPGMSGSVVLLHDWPDPKIIWAYGVVQDVPASFDGQLRVARLADAWQPNAEFRKRLVAAGVADEEAEDPTGAVFPFPDQASPPRPFAGVPARTPSFTGREAELDQLDTILLGDRSAAVTQVAGSPTAQIGRAAVQGMGGVGKTSLAVEYVHRYRDFYAGVWWCAAETRIGLLTSLAGLAVELGAATADEADVERAAKAGLRRLAEQHATFLLVYDNVASPEIIADLLPASGARVLVTSRFPDWGDWAEEVALDVLPQAEAVAFLMSRTGRQDEAGATLLADALGRLPLALDHAAAYCRRSQTRFADYAAKAESLIAAAPRGAIYPRSVAATFSLAITEAVELCPAAEVLMTYLAQCGPERIPLVLVEGAITDEMEHGAALLALTEVSLVRHDPFEDGTPAVIVHRLVRAVARAQAEAKGSAISAAEWVTKRLLEIYPSDGDHNPVSWPLCAQLTPHALALHEAGAAGNAESPQWAELLERAAGYLYGRASYGRAERLLRAALIVRERTFDPEHLEVAAKLNDLGRILRDKDDLAGAEACFQRTLAIREKKMGPIHLDVATSVDDLGLVRWKQVDLAGARACHVRALTIRETLLGQDHPDVATSVNHLGRVLRDQDDLVGARACHVRALKTRETLFGENHLDVATSSDDLGVVLYHQGCLTEALVCHNRALKIRETLLGQDHPDVATSVNNLGRVLTDTNDLDDARACFERALKVRETVFNGSHTTVANSLDNLGVVLRKQGDLAGARECHVRALKIREFLLGPNHATVANSTEYLGVVLYQQGDMAGAKVCFGKTLELRKLTLSPEHHKVATSLNHLGAVLRKQGDLTGARACYERALTLCEAALSADHPNTIEIRRHLADMWMSSEGIPAHTKGQNNRTAPL